MRIINGCGPETADDYSEPEGLGIVREVLGEVRLRGDAAVRKYAERFDGYSGGRFEVSKEQIRRAYGKVDREFVWALKKAAANIKSFAKRQYRQLRDFETRKKGVILGQRVVPLTTVGCYIPGGRYPLPSTALMCVIPAKIAGVPEVIVCSPNIKPATLVAADIAGADRIFSIGGVQAIAAMAYGTESVPKVDKIMGPGNKYVAAAKREVYGAVGIDFIAGPSEVLIIADDSGNAGFIAADMLAQAEHDPGARSTLITTSRKLAKAVNREVSSRLESLANRRVIEESMENSRIIIVRNLEEAVRISNRQAPEHLELQVRTPDEIIPELRNYGSLFIGSYSAEVFGDYCSGTNHILPTGGAARYTGGLSVRDFVKVLTYQRVTREGSPEMIRLASKIAEVEGLDAHAKAALIRSKQ